MFGSPFVVSVGCSARTIFSMQGRLALSHAMLQSSLLLKTCFGVKGNGFAVVCLVRVLISDPGGACDMRTLAELYLDKGHEGK
jgi:20S proteasome alpha/beta subunit